MYKWKIAKKLQQLTALGIAAAVLTVMMLSGMTALAQPYDAPDQDFATPGIGEQETPATQRAFESFQTETPFYDETAVDCVVSSVDANEPGGQNFEANGNSNAEKAFNFMFDRAVSEGISKEMAAAQAAGWVGNWMQESNVNPAAVGGPAHGIAQWEGPRWPALQRYVESYNRLGRAEAAANGTTWVNVTWKDLTVQLNFVWHELHNSEKSAWNAIKVTKTPAEAAQVISRRYQRPGDPRIPNRINYANAAYNKYAAAKLGSSSATPQPTAGTVTDPAAACADTNTGGNTDGVNVDGYAFPVAPRTQIDYTTLPCGASGEFPGIPGRGGVRTYTDRYGNSQRVRLCHGGGPAFDIYESNYKSSGKAIYAITAGITERINTNYTNPSSRGAAGKACHSMHFKSTLNGRNYWYGHVLITGGNNSKGKQFKAGEQVGVVAPTEYKTRCWGGAPHLHIDQGCSDKSGKAYTGGNDSCRDAAIYAVLHKVWRALPK